MDLDQVVDRYHGALDEFSRGSPEPVKEPFSRRDAVTLANPFGPAVRGWNDVDAALSFASSRFRDGTVEHWRAKVAGRDEVAQFELRVTSTFRREGGSWRLVHRHADSIATPDPDGPLRSG